MKFTDQQSHAIDGVEWFVGIGILIVTGWWPGVMFVAGAGVLTQGLMDGRGWGAFPGAYWLFGIGVWALFDYSAFVLLATLALSGLLETFVKPPPSAVNKKPVDLSLE